MKTKTELNMKVNFACGNKVLPGWCNIDAQPNTRSGSQPDHIYEMKFNEAGALLEPMPIKDNCVSILQAHHFIEHVYAWEAPSVINEFKRVLTDGGHLIMELPDIEKACQNLLNGQVDQMTMWPLYGNPNERDPYMCHKWGYTKPTMQELLMDCGMRNIVFLHPQTHGKRSNRDMRVECRKR